MLQSTILCRDLLMMPIHARGKLISVKTLSAFLVDHMHIFHLKRENWQLTITSSIGSVEDELIVVDKIMQSKNYSIRFLQEMLSTINSKNNSSSPKTND